MARYVLPVAGAAVGFYFGGPQGAALGWTVGAAIGGVVDPQELPAVTREGNRLSDLQVSSSAYGTFIPITWGTVRTGGNIIWALPIIEEKNVEEQEQGGKGGPTQKVTTVTYSYFATFALAFGEGEAAGAIRIWADTKLIYSIYNEDARDVVNPSSNGILGVGFDGFTFYPGNETQEPDPLIVADKGDLAPAHRGMCYIVFERLPLAQFGNRIPNITVEVAFEGIDRSVSASFIDTEGTYTPNNLYAVVDYERGRAYGLDNLSGTVTRWDFASGTPTLAVETNNITAWQASLSGNSYNISNYGGLSPTDGRIYFYGDDGQGTNKFLGLNPDTLIVDQVTDIPIGWPGFNTAAMRWWPTYIITQLGQRIEYMIFAGPATGESNRPFHMAVIKLPTLNAGIGIGVQAFFDDTAFPDPVDPTEALNINAYMTTAVVPNNNETFRVYMLAGRGGENASVPTHGDADTKWFIYRATVAPLINVILDGEKEVEFSINDLITEFPELSWSSTPTPAVKSLIEMAWDWGDNSSLMFRLEIYTENTTTNEQTFWFKWDVEAKAWAWGSSDFSIFDDTSTIGHSGDTQSYIFNNTYLHSNSGNFVKIYDTRTGQLKETIPYTDNLEGGNWFDSSKGLLWIHGTGTPEDFALIDVKGATGQDANVQDIIDDITTKVGLNPALYSQTTSETVGSFQLSRLAPARQALTSLATAFNFDLIESDFGLKVVERGGASATNISEDDLVSSINAEQETFTEQRATEVGLPMKVNVICRDRDLDYQNRSQFVKRIQNPVKAGYSDNTLSFAFPMTLEASQAKQIAEKLLFASWSERITYAYALPQKYLANEPTDIVTVQTSTANFEQRLTQTSIGQDFTIDCLGIATDSAQYISDSTAGSNLGFRPPSLPGTDLTRYFLLDTPLLRDLDDNLRQYDLHYHASAGYGSGLWPGAAIFKSSDNVNFANLEQNVNEATWGTIIDFLPDTERPFTPDDTSVLKVSLVTGSLSSVTDDQLLNERGNVAAVFKSNGDIEIIQFRDVTSLGGSEYEISYILRGRRGTDWAVNDHDSSESFVMLTTSAVVSTTVGLDELNVIRYYKAVAFGADVNQIGGLMQTSAGNTLKPYAPVDREATTDNTDIAFTWERRTRLQGHLVDGTGTVPLNEDSEEYEIDIYNAAGDTIIRTVTGLTSTDYDYLNADIITDFGSIPSTIKIVVYQISAQAGRGFPSMDTFIDVVGP